MKVRFLSLAFILALACSLPNISSAAEREAFYPFLMPCAAGDVYVDGHYRRDGTYVQPHYRTAPNRTRNDNYSTRGNVNPYTGERGTRPRDWESRRSGTYGNQRYSGHYSSGW